MFLLHGILNPFRFSETQRNGQTHPDESFVKFGVRQLPPEVQLNQKGGKNIFMDIHKCES